MKPQSFYKRLKSTFWQNKELYLINATIIWFYLQMSIGWQTKSQANPVQYHEDKNLF